MPSLLDFLADPRLLQQLRGRTAPSPVNGAFADTPIGLSQPEASSGPFAVSDALRRLADPPANETGAPASDVGQPRKIEGRIGEVKVIEVTPEFLRMAFCDQLTPRTISLEESMSPVDTGICLLFKVSGAVSVTIICEERSNDSEMRPLNRWETKVDVHAVMPNEVYWNPPDPLPGAAGKLLRNLMILRLLAKIPEGIEKVRNLPEVIEALRSDAIRQVLDEGLDQICQIGDR